MIWMSDFKPWVHSKPNHLTETLKFIELNACLHHHVKELWRKMTRILPSTWQEHPPQQITDFCNRTTKLGNESLDMHWWLLPCNLFYWFKCFWTRKKQQESGGAVKQPTNHKQFNLPKTSKSMLHPFTKISPYINESYNLQRPGNQC